MHLTRPLIVLLPVFTLGSCLFDLIIGFISSRIKASRAQTMTQQGHQLLEFGRKPMSNLNLARQRFRQQMSLFKFPGAVIGKEQYS
jgi:hypothetical protein